MKDGFVKAAAATPDIRVADVAYNTENICKMIDETVANGAKVNVFTEFCVTGYTCSDLFMQDILLKEAKEALKNMDLVDTPFSPQLPVGSLHWLIADETGSITVEAVKEGLMIYDNPAGVLTNNPPFPQQMFQLNNYMHLSPRQPVNTFSKDLPLNTYSRGMGALGLPGDLSSSSRFVRASYVKMNSRCNGDELSSVRQFFHILGSVDQQRGCCEVSEGAYEITIYTSCCNTTKGIYYYTTYDNHQITAVDMYAENLDSDKLIRYPIILNGEIRWHNK